MDKHNAVLDASFWINTHRSGLVDYLLDYFDLAAPTQVMHEIEYMPPDVGQLTPAGETFRRWREEGRLKLKDPAAPVDWFHPGENAATLVSSEIARHLKRAALTALQFLAQQRSEQDDNAIS